MAWRKGGWLVAAAVALGSCTSTRGDGCPPRATCGERALVADAGPGRLLPSAAGPACGDGVLDPGEQCDDGSACADGRRCTDDRYRCDGVTRASCQARGGDGCSAACTLEPSPACRVDGRGLDCSSSPGLAPGLPIDSAPVPAPEASGDPGGEFDETDTATEPPGCTLGEFPQPEPIQGLDPSLRVWAPALSADGRTLYFAAHAGDGIEALYTAQRVASNQVSETTRLSALASDLGDGTPFLSFDGLSLYFYSSRAGGGDRDLWQATRPGPGVEFGEPRMLSSINTFALDHLPWLSADELTLLFVSTRAGTQGASDIWISTRPARDASFAVVLPLAGVNGAGDEGRAVLSRDQTTIFFASAREETPGDYDLWMAARASANLPFGPARNLDVLNSEGRDMDPFLTANERELWFASDRSGSVTLWRSVRDCTE